ncbi:hypothetical protein HMPREF3212_02269 [Citrobacter freundii]|nr:hypothetical protein HMPREF3212_02269 [Citrobacter freundii]
MATECRTGGNKKPAIKAGLFRNSCGLDHLFQDVAAQKKLDSVL